MKFNHMFSSILLAILIGLSVNTSIADVSVDPFGFAAAVELDEESNVDLSLINESNEEVGFSFDYRLIIEEDDNRFGPRRDDLGDEIRAINGPDGNWFGIAWDGEWIWGLSYADSRMVAFNEEGEQVANFRAEIQSSTGLTWDGEGFWTGASNNQLVRFDRQGNTIGSFNVQGALPRGVTWDGQNLWYSNLSGQRVVQQVTVEGEVLRDLDLQDIDATRLSVVWVPEHRDGHLWTHHTSGELLQLNVENDRPEIIQRFQLHIGGNNWGIEHDGENLWYLAPNRWICFDDGVAEFHMLTMNPGEGVIPGEDSVPVEIHIGTEDIEAGVYNIMLEIELFDPDEERDDLEQTLIEISAVITVDDPTFNLSGTVTDAATEDVIEGVTTDIDRFVITRFSNDEGVYSFDDLPLGAYEFTFSATDYLPMIREVNAQEEGDVELDVALFHSECNPDPDEIITELAPDSDTQRSIEISNDGNGPLTYTVERRLLGDANADPWTLRLSHMFGEDREDSRIQGVVFADDRFYVAGAHGNEPAIYIFDREGEYVDLFIQPGEDRYGMKDLAWDGSLIWGAIGEMIYGMTLDGDVEVEFEGPFRPTSNLAWDPEHELLWVSATTSDIAGIDRNGDLVSELDHQGLRMYGFGYWPDDPDDSPLYIFHKVRDVSDLVVHKMNLDNAELTEVSILEPECGGSAAGAFITNEYDIYSWVFISVANNGADDRVDIWQVDARKEWFLLDPMEGVIEANNTQEFELTLDATGLPPEVFEGELVFLHDGVGSETHIPVTLRVVEGPVQAERTIQLDIGWNMVSVNLQPDPDDIRVLMRELVEADLLILMKDGLGRFYSPEFDFCNIPGWNVTDGYQMKMDDAEELTLAGITVMADDAIPLTDGWNLISYYPRAPVDAIVAFSGIVDQLLMAKDGWGRFYNPEWGFSNMGDLQELRGYQVKVTEDLELVYRLQAEDDDFVVNVHNQQGELPAHPNTGNNMSLLVRGGSTRDCEIGSYADGELVGSGILQKGVGGIAIWGDDPTTTEIDGALDGASLELKLLDENGLQPVQFKTLTGDGLYQTDGFWTVELLDITEIPDEFGIISTYPNPFNSQTHLTFNLPEASRIDLALFSLSGRRVMNIESAQKNAGQYTTTIDGALLSSGVYIVQLKACGHEMRSKITLVK